MRRCCCARLPLIMLLPLLLFCGAVNSAKDGRKRILFMADNNYYSHYKLATKLANILHRSGQYEVHFVAADYTEPGADRQKVRSALDEQILFVPIRMDRDFEGSFYEGVQRDNVFRWNQKITHIPLNWALLRYKAVALYKEIMENPRVRIAGANNANDVPILEWLRSNHYDLAVAEYGLATGAFVVFNELGIGRTVAYSATPGHPALFHYLGATIPLSVPEYYNAEPGDGTGESGIRLLNSKRQESNKQAYEETISMEFKHMYEQDYQQWVAMAEAKWAERGIAVKPHKPVPVLSALLNRACFYLVNHNQLTGFPKPVLDKIKYIGGIAVEQQQQQAAAGSSSKLEEMPKKKKQKQKKSMAQSIKRLWFTGLFSSKSKQKQPAAGAAPVVIFSLGTIMSFDGIEVEAVTQMLEAFNTHYEDYEFHVRIDVSKVKQSTRQKLQRHIQLYDMQTMIPQQQLLATRDVRLFIIHCGQNSLTEALYTGVPVICIPFFGDQHYNAAVMEYIGVGLWVEHVNFATTFVPAFNEAMKKDENNNNKYLEMAKRVAAALRNQREQPRDIFLGAIRSAIQTCAHRGAQGDEEVSAPVAYDPRFRVKNFVKILAESENLK